MGPSDATLTTGISRLLATVQASANSVGMLPETRKKSRASLGRKNNSISDSLGSVMKTAIIPTDSGRQSVCSDDQSTSEARGVQLTLDFRNRHDTFNECMINTLDNLDFKCKLELSHYVPNALYSLKLI